MLDLTGLAAGLDLGPVRLLTLLPRFLASLAVGGLIAARPWRLLMRRRLPRAEMIQAQVLLCAAAAIVIVVIGDSLAKAFGLVGLGSFVRFRSGLKDPRDAAILFLIIGLGMACGHGILGVALCGAALSALLLFVFDLVGGESPAPEETAKGDPAPAPATAAEPAGAAAAAAAGVAAAER